jgi:hypothetical protein
MSRQQAIAEHLLTGARDARSQPIRIGNDVRRDDVYGLGVAYHGGGQYVGHGVEGLESLVNGDLENCRRRVYRTVDNFSSA